MQSSRLTIRIPPLTEPGRKPSSKSREPDLYRFAYDRDPSRIFSEPQWLIRAKGSFLASEALGELGAYLEASWTWEQHLAASTIIPVDMAELFPPMPHRAIPLPRGTPIGCPWCFRIHRIDRYGWVMPFANHRACYDLYNGWKLPSCDYAQSTVSEE
jgi:hypothetical protein